MKRSLLLPVVFISAFIIITIFSATGYMICTECLKVSVGTKVNFFNAITFLYGIAYSIPVSAVTACIYMIFYAIRHESNRGINFLFYSLISALIWVVLIPASFALTDKLNEKFYNFKNTEVQTVSPHFFRETDDQICYIEKIDENKKASGVFIRHGIITPFADKELDELFPKNKGISFIADPILFKYLAPKGAVNQVLKVIQTFLEIVPYSYKGRGIYLLAVLSLALAIQSIYGLAEATKWRLCNGTFVAAAFIFISILNTQLFISPLATKIMAFFIERNVEFLSDRRFLQIIINLLIFIVNLIIGLVKAFTNPNANKEVTEE
ncbi:MAG: hypothetical protein K6G52_01395 [Treponemataceae bacterium]|nr:hypothetical protein [Treponemataceae bacterium]